MAKWGKKSGNIAAPSEQEIKGEKTTESPIAERATAPGRGRRGRTGRSRRAGVKRVAESTAALVAYAATIICVLLALHIAFVVFSANDANSIVRTVNGIADRCAWRFRDIFVPRSERVGVLVNYGIAAAVYLIAGRVVAGLIRRIR